MTYHYRCPACWLIRSYAFKPGMRVMVAHPNEPRMVECEFLGIDCGQCDGRMEYVGALEMIGVEE